jgi:hypothetical protein
MSDELPFAKYPGAGRVLIVAPMPSGGTARRGYARELLAWCGFRCSYCGLDMTTFEGWLQLSVDHVVPSAAAKIGIPTVWLDNAVNKVACCRPCNDLFNRDTEVDTCPTSLDEFLAVRDSTFVRRRQCILERRQTEKAWFLANATISTDDTAE